MWEDFHKTIEGPIVRVGAVGQRPHGVQSRPDHVEGHCGEGADEAGDDRRPEGPARAPALVIAGRDDGA